MPVPTGINEIDRLALGEALDGCGNDISAAAGQSTAEYLSVRDNEATGCSEWEEGNSNLPTDYIVHNPSLRNIVFLPFDHNLLTDRAIISDGVADCAILTSDLLSFIEFKTNATSTKARAIKKNTNKAIKQLWHTFDGIIKPRCAARGKDIENELSSIEFHIVFNRSLSVTALNAYMMNRSFEFLDLNNYPLFFDHGQEV